MNFRRRPVCVQLCIETLCKQATLLAHLTNVSFEFFCKIFTEDAPLPLLRHGAKKSKMTKNSTQGGSCLNLLLVFRSCVEHSWLQSSGESHLRWHSEGAHSPLDRLYVPACIFTARARESGHPGRSIVQEALLSVLFWGTFFAWYGFERLFFFSACLKDSQCLLMCRSKVGTGKSPNLSDFTLAGVASLSHLLRVSHPDLRSARATFKRNNLSHARGKC